MYEWWAAGPWVTDEEIRRLGPHCHQLHHGIIVRLDGGGGNRWIRSSGMNGNPAAYGEALVAGVINSVLQSYRFISLMLVSFRSLS